MTDLEVFHQEKIYFSDRKLMLKRLRKDIKRLGCSSDIEFMFMIVYFLISLFSIKLFESIIPLIVIIIFFVIHFFDFYRNFKSNFQSKYKQVGIFKIVHKQRLRGGTCLIETKFNDFFSRPEDYSKIEINKIYKVEIIKAKEIFSISLVE